MKVRVEDKGECRKIVYIETPSEAIKDDYEKVVKAFAKAGKIAGFRPGKAPRDIVERQFSKQIEEETKERLLPQIYRQAVEDKQLKIASIIDISEVQFSKVAGMAFSVTVDVIPEFKLPKYKKITLRTQDCSVKDDSIEQSLKRLLENFSKFEDVNDRAVIDEDLVRVDYSSECEGKSVEEIAKSASGLGEGKDFWVIAGTNEALPFTAELPGTVVGDQKTINVHFPDDYRVTDVAGKDAVYNVAIKGIRTKVIPQLDDELLKKFQVKDEAELRERIRTDLQSETDRMEKERLKEEITKFLLSKTSFDLPQSIVDYEARIVERSMHERLSMRGGMGQQTEQELTQISDMAKQSSRDRVKASYILARIAEEEDIAVSEEDLDNRLGMMAMRYGMQRNHLRSELEKRGSLDNIRSDIMSDKTLNFLLEHAKIKK